MSGTHAIPNLEAPKAKKPFYKKWWVIALAVVLFVVVVSSAINAANGTGSDAGKKVVNESIKTEATEPPAEIAETEEAVVEDAPVEEPAPAEPVYTVGQQNAIDKANQYLGFMGFSRTGLIDQLVFEKFSAEDATFAVDAIAPDWNAQAAKKAQSYVDMTAFSRDGLIDQLVFEGFTPEEANAGVTAIGY